MSRKREDFEPVTIKNAKPEFEANRFPETKKEESHYQCLSTTNREEPEQFMNSTRKHETEQVALEPDLYMNITYAKKEAQPSPGLSQEKGADKDAADVTPAPAVLSHHRTMNTYIKAEPVTEKHNNVAGSDNESDTSDFTPASSHSPPQQNSTSTNCIPYINTPTSIGKQSFASPYLKSDENSLDSTAPDDDNLQTISSSSKKDGKGSRSKCLLMVCCVLVIFLVFTLLLTFVWLNRSELEKNQAEGSQSTVTSNMLIMNLTKQVRDLEESLSQSNTVIESLSNQNQLLSSSIDSHSTRLAAAENTLQSHVTDYRDLVSTSENNHDTLTASISGNYADLNNRINTLQGVVNTYRNRANSQISQLQSGISLESRCRKNSVSCDVNGNTRVYQLSCSTQNISLTTGVSHLLACLPSMHSFNSLPL